MRDIIIFILIASLITTQVFSGQTALAQTGVSGPPTYRLLLISSPSKADVFIDGRKVGTTPYAGRLKQGRYQIRVSKDRYALWDRRVQLQEDQRIVFTLSRLPEPRKRTWIWTFLGILVAGGAAAGAYGVIRNRMSGSSSGPTGRSELPEDPPGTP